MPTLNGKIVSPVDFRRDVARTLQRSTGDEGQLCGDFDEIGRFVGRINKWSRRKPVRWSTPGGPTDNELQALRYGMDFSPLTDWDDDHDSTVLRWDYLLPRGLQQHEWFRILDFDGYNHNAIPPIVDTASFLSGSASPDGGQFLFDLTRILATGSNVELPLSLFPSVFPRQYYLGVCFSSDTRADEVWWTSVPVTLEMLLSGQQLSNHAYYIPFKEAPGWQDGDDVIGCYCLAPRALITDETDTSPKSTDPTGIIPIVPRSGYGSWQLSISAYKVGYIQALYDSYPKQLPISPSIQGQNVIVSGINFEVQTGAETYLYSDSEVRIIFRGYINGTRLGNDIIRTISSNVTLQGEILTIYGEYTESIQDLIQDDYEISFRVECWLERSPSDVKTLFYGKYNTNSGNVEWHTNN